jgi:hypothetical protein
VGLTKRQAESLGLGHLWPEPIEEPWAGPQPSKYRNQRTEYNGVWYASKAEARRAEELDQIQRNGFISWWIGQPKFRLGCPENIYIGDFLVLSKNNGARVEDVKGFVTPKFKRDLKLWRKYGPCPLWLILDGRIQVIEPEGK